MARPKECRTIGCLPDVNFYKPKGIPLSQLEVVTITLDEFESIRLADLEGLYQEVAAEKMNISRQTFGRIIDSAHSKIADALIHGKALSIEGGNVENTSASAVRCKQCAQRIGDASDILQTGQCPKCRKAMRSGATKQKGKSL